MTKNSTGSWVRRVGSLAESALDAAADQLRAALGGPASAPMLRPIPVRVRGDDRSGRR